MAHESTLDSQSLATTLIMCQGMAMESPPISYLHLFGENYNGNFTSAEKSKKGDWSVQTGNGYMG
jgi:hypothetical protein